MFTRKRLILALQIVLLTAMIVFLTIEVKSSRADLKPRLEEMDYRHVVAAGAILASYYLIFVVGWVIIMRALDMRIGYADALGAEMLSMLAKYIPGGVWTPAARVVATRRIGLPAGPVLASVGYEAGLSAIAGVIVFALSLPFAPSVDLPVPLWTIIAFAALLVVLLHPRIYGPAADRLLEAPRRRADSPAADAQHPRRAGVLRRHVAAGRPRAASDGARVRRRRAALGDRATWAVRARSGRSCPCWWSSRRPASACARERCTRCSSPTWTRRPPWSWCALNRLLLTAVEAMLLGGVTAYRRMRMRALVEPEPVRE